MSGGASTATGAARSRTIVRDDEDAAPSVATHHALPSVAVHLDADERASLDALPLVTADLETGPVRVRVVRRVVYTLALVVVDGDERATWIDAERLT